MKRLRIVPYKMGSESARVLAREVGCLRVHPHSTTYHHRRGTVAINWGCSVSTIPCRYWLNHPDNVAFASNKLASLNQFSTSGVSCPEWTQSALVAKEWIDDGELVYCRTKLSGKGGDGIVIASCIDELVEAPLYTKRVNSGKEYRVHVFNGKVIDYAKKGRRRDAEHSPSHLIRNYTKGWVFVREGVELPQACAEQAVKAVEALGLDFGAVDVCTIKGDETQAVVFEVNTAAGMSAGSTTVKAYAKAIWEYLQ